MRTLGILIIFLLKLLGPAQAFSQDARLSYKLYPGKIYLLDVEMQQKTSSESMNNEEINMYSNLLLEFRVDSITADKRYHMSVSYKKLHLSMLAPGLGIDLNSKTGKNPLLTDLADSLQGQWFRLSMDESGKLRSLEGLAEIFEKLFASPKPELEKEQAEISLLSLREAYGPEAFKGLFNIFVAFYPSVQAIRNWTNDINYYFNTKQVEMANRYYLTKNTGKVVTIQGMGMINASKEYHETIPLGEVSSTVSGTQTYDFQTDDASGWLIRCVSKQRLIIETTILKSSQLPAGLKIPSYTETAFEVKGSIQ